MTRTRTLSRLALLAAIVVLASLPALAQSGSPQLDPTNNSTGTAYTISIQGSAKPLDPSAGKGATGKLVGTMTIFQSAAAPDFTADMLLDTNGDGNPTAPLTCDGSVGSGRVGFSCQGVAENGDDVFIMVLGKAVSHAGKVTFLAAKGLGFTDKFSLTFVFAGQQN
ncbi:MAG: hypothetical protein HY049_08415 [Acidobacteria bacterium]|nr:hypothetical protein [Acidobacteriota bacterium]